MTGPKISRFLLFCIFGLIISALPLGGALAAEGGQKGSSEVVFLFQIMALIFVGRLLGEMFQRMGQPAVTGQLIAGILLGPSVLGVLWPDFQHWLFPPQKEQKAMLDAVSQLGILMLLLLTGMETDLRLVRRAGLAAASVSIAGIIVPFACGFTLGEFLPDSMLPRPELRIITSLFLGTALSIASIKIVAMVVREMHFMRRNLGQLIVSSAIIDDSVGWIIISIIFSLAEHGAIDLPSVARSVLGTAIFLALSLTVGRRIVFFIIRWTNDNFVSELPVISAILLIMGGMALITHFIGVHTVLGAFVAGVLIGESPILTKHIDEQLRGLITAFFAPIFFGVAGIGTDLTILKDPNLLALTLGLILIASVGKFGGAFIGGAIGGLNRRESLALALGMNARGSTEVIIATIGLSLGALSQNLFSMIVAMAVVTTMMMPPTLRWALSRVPLRKEEEERLDREAFVERGFVTSMERLLLAVDGSANGKFASRLGGLLAGSFGLPTTVLHIDASKPAPGETKESAKEKQPDDAVQKDTANGQKAENARGKEKSAGVEIALTEESKEKDKKEKADDRKEAKEKEDKKDEEKKEAMSAAQATVKAAAEKTKPLEVEETNVPPPSVDVVAKAPAQAAAPEDAVAGEASKGYDFMLIGLEKTMSEPGVFHDSVSRVASGFEGPLAVVMAHGRHAKRPLQSRFKILAPVTGTAVSRRGAEVALALAHAASAPITALFVSSAPRSNRTLRRLRQDRATRRSERAILKDIVELADNFDTPMTTAARRNDTAEDAILREARRGGYDLIVMGVNRRPGDTLYFGRVAAAVMERAEFSVLFVASESYAQERRPADKKEVAR